MKSFPGVFKVEMVARNSPKVKTVYFRNDTDFHIHVGMDGE